MSERKLEPRGPVQVELSHVVLRTAHLDACVDWYGKVLGMHANMRSAFGAALANDGEHHRIALAAVPAGSERAGSMSPGLEHLAYKLAGIADLLGNYLRLCELGIEPFICIHHGGTISFYYQDPDGVQVELFIDALAHDLAIEQMNGEAFRANPIGCPFDPKEMVSRYRAGESIRELFTPPPFQPELLAPLIRVRSGQGAPAR